MGKSNRNLLYIFFKTFGIFIKKRPKQYCLMVLLSFLPAIVSPIRMHLEQIIYDQVYVMEVSASVNKGVYQAFASFILVQMLYVVVYPLFRSHVNYFGSELETILQNDINSKTSKISLEHYELSSFYNEVALASSASRELRFMTMMFSSEILLYLFQFFSVSSLLFVYSPALTCLSFISIIPDILVRVIKSKWNYYLIDKTQPLLRRKRYFESVLTSPQSIKEIRVLKNYKYFTMQWEMERNKYNQENWLLQKRVALIDAACQFVNVLTIICTYLITTHLAIKGEITIGTLGAALGAVTLLKSNFGRICNLAMFSFECGMKGKYYYKILDYSERGGERNNNISVNNGISMKNVRFSYAPQQDVLQGISLEVLPGERVAIVGENGSGKTTLVKLLLGLYQPQEGTVCWGKDRINNISEDCMYKESSAVFQDFCRYALTLQQNIAISDTRNAIDVSKIQKLLKMVSFKCDTCTLNSNLMREFGGLELSGGNWQKLAIARGLYRDHKLIVFDEPTAALDPIVEEEIIRSMLELDCNSTKIFVTHRLSTTKFANKIIVLESGKIVGCGTHDQLLKSNQTYQKLWNAQAQWYMS